MGVVPPRAFISYSASDETQDFVRWLRERLAGSGLVTPWLDEIDMRKIGAWRPWPAQTSLAGTQHLTWPEVVLRTVGANAAVGPTAL